MPSARISPVADVSDRGSSARGSATIDEVHPRKRRASREHFAGLLIAENAPGASLAAAPYQVLLFRVRRYFSFLFSSINNSNLILATFLETFSFLDGP
ncbi:Hypothetical protein NTJ_06427 [Nesidiocoris tenuis]|uniref:Uncharacterized protein n=1 Tax=Nesidiocoris tenuis TaxID=355587 RepID=A0ABN7ANH4_9HEMI|nr:Hypothetical protein NTJ_06427 [Nesidiocoris tenuis]